jgi:NADH dehydrogenase
MIDSRTGRGYPRVAPIALSQGIRAAANIENLVHGRPLEGYQAFHAGKIVSLGRGVAFADVLGFQLRGRSAWWMYRMAYLLKLIGLKNKVRVVMTLLLNKIFERDLAASGSRPAPPAALDG